MAIHRKARVVTILLIFPLAGGGASALAASANTSTADAATRFSHSTQALPTALRPVFYQALAKDAGATYAINKDGCAVLAKQELKACFDAHGVHFTGATPVSLHLVAYGRSGELSPVGAMRPGIHGNRVAYEHGNLSAWWRVLPMGFEQGFTIARRPGGHGELTLALAMTRHSRAGGNPPKTSPSVPLRSEGGKELAWGKLRYGKLVVTDANGKVVPATLTSQGGRVLIAVNDARAAYPLTIDPLVWVEQSVTASDGREEATFGKKVAMEGSTAVICGGGRAYVFDYNDGRWSQTAELASGDGGPTRFGASVALSGDTIVLGTPLASFHGNRHQGAAYIFSKTNGTWTKVARLVAYDGAADDGFGGAVAISGTTVLVGAADAAVNGNAYQGAAYVFGYRNGHWQPTAKLTAHDGTPNDKFGAAVALDGTTAVVGAPFAPRPGRPKEGAVYVFKASSGVWYGIARLVADHGSWLDYFGSAIAISGTTVLVGAPFEINDNGGEGVAYVFQKSSGTLTQTAELVPKGDSRGAQFGYSVAIEGTTALIGAHYAYFPHLAQVGAAYVFRETPNGTWAQTTRLLASGHPSGAEFGSSVALSGSVALVGAPGQNVDHNQAQGVAYFEGRSDFGLAVSAPAVITQGLPYVSQTIATNNASVSSPAVTATMAVPAAASFISATSSQGSCSEASGVVTCDFGSISGNGGTATANVTLKAIGNPGTTIENVSGIAKATPPLTASAPTMITAAGACPAGYTEIDGSLDADQYVKVTGYAAPAGMENGILSSPSGFQLYVQTVINGTPKLHRIPGNEVHHYGPAGSYNWYVKAGDTEGAYTLCLKHP